MIQEVKMALVFAFPKLLYVICYLYRKKIIFGNCQLSTVTLGIDDMNMCPCHCPCHLVPMSFAIMLHFANMFAKSVICYLLS